MRRAIFAAALVLAAPVAHAAEHDVAWFEARPAVREQWLRSCRGDARIALDPRCGNAEAAETRAYARRQARKSGIAPGVLPREFETPLILDAARIACARPPAERGMLGAYCRRT